MTGASSNDMRKPFVPPVIVPPPVRYVSLHDPKAHQGCPSCQNKSLVPLKEETMEWMIGIYCGVCNIRWEFI